MSSDLGVYNAEQVRALDRYAIEKCGIPSYELMTRAGAGALELLVRRWPAARHITVVCGPGNNGGDGYVLARLARERGVQARVASVVDVAQLRGDAARARDDLVVAGGRIEPWGESVCSQADVIVDAIFGTGLTRGVSGPIAEAIARINAADKPILALDMPSGLHADSGLVLGEAVRATSTITFIARKLGFYLGVGPDYTGELHLDTLEAPRNPSIAPPVQLIDAREIVRVFGPRLRTTHKGAQGRVLILGGGPGMAGAARLAGEAALRTGAGLVTVGTRPENTSAIVSGRPELICRGLAEGEAAARLIEQNDVIAVGPGLGQDAWGNALVEAAFASGKPLIVDADALNLLAQRPALARAGCLLTPHPGEAARLLGIQASAVQQDRLHAARALVERYRAHVVLKGAGSIVAAVDGALHLCDRGNPGMATAGMGDVLTGVVASIAAQTGDLAAAARLGVFIHAAAGDLAAGAGERGLIASDLFAHLRACVNPSR